MDMESKFLKAAITVAGLFVIYQAGQGLKEYSQNRSDTAKDQREEVRDTGKIQKQQPLLINR